MPMILRNGKICLPSHVVHSPRRRRGATSPACKEQQGSGGGTRSPSPLTINSSPPESRATFKAGDHRHTVSCCTEEEWLQVEGEKRITASYLDQLQNSPDPRDHVLFCYHGEKRALCDDFHALSRSQGLKAFEKLVNGLFFAAVLCLLGTLIGGPVALDWYASLGDAGLVQLSDWRLRLLTEESCSGGYANQGRQCKVKRRLRGFVGAAPMIPLLNQLGQQPIQSTSTTVFNVRRRSSGTKGMQDWEALLELQRDCALPAPRGEAAASTRGYTVSTTVQNGNVVIHIPRTMFLSSVNAPAYIREVCRVPQNGADSAVRWLWGGNGTRACSSGELLAFSVFVEKHLQRQALREFLDTRTETETHRNDLTLPPYPYCLVKSNRRNAPFFTSRQWEAVSLVTHLSRAPIDVLSRNMKTIIQQASGGPLRGDTQGGGNSDIAAVLQTVGADCDEELLDLDIKDAISVVYSKSFPDGEQNEAVFPAALEFEAGLDTYTWDTRTRLALSVDRDGFTRTAAGDSFAGSVVPFNRGELNNIHLLHRFGITAPGNPWGSVFFLRNGIVGNAAAASPAGEGLVSEQLRPIFTTQEAEENLPEWLLKKKTTGRFGSLCFHPRTAYAETPQGACRRLMSDRFTRAPVLKDVQIEKEHHLGETTPGDDRLKNSHLECDYKTVFTSNVFGYGAFSLNKNEPIGGIRKEQYLCVRAMLAEEPVDAAETDASDESIRVLAEAEIKAADFFMETCSRQLQYLMEAVKLVRATQSSRELDNADYSRPDTKSPGRRGAEENLLFLGVESEYAAWQRSLKISQLMVNAMQAEETVLRRCISYFTDVHRRASRWQ